MTRTIFLLSFLPALALSACDSKDQGIDEEADADADSDTDADTDSDADTDADTDADAYFDPAAVGFEYVGGWSAADDELTTYFSGGKEYSNYVLITFADLDYFSASDTAAQEGHYCEVYSSFSWAPSSFDTETYDYTTGTGGTGEATSVMASYEGFLSFSEKNMAQDTCFNLDPDVYTNGTLTELFNGMHFGIGFGQASDYTIEAFGDNYTKYADSLLTVYTAVNHADGEGGYNFIGYDWNYTFLYSWDSDTHEIEVDSDNYLVPAGNVGDPYPEGYMQSGSFWLEDFPNLDLSLMLEGGK